MLARYRAANLVGAPEDVVAQLRPFAEAGVDHLGVVFLGQTLEELLADMALFARAVMPAVPAACG